MDSSRNDHPEPCDALPAIPKLFPRMEGWETLTKALASGSSGTIDGAWGSSAAAAAAALAEIVQGVLLIVVPGPGEIAPWQLDLESFREVPPALFPANETWPPLNPRGRLADETSQRLKLIQTLSQKEITKILLAPFSAIMQPVPPREELEARGRKVVVGSVTDSEELTQWLTARKYKRTDAVEYPGEYARRGGILDIFPPDADHPLRLEFFGDELESIRVFDAASQRSLETRREVVLLGFSDDGTLGLLTARTEEPNSRRGKSVQKLETPRSASLVDHLPIGSVVVLVEPEELKQQGKQFYERVADPTGLFSVAGAFGQLMRFPTVAVSTLPRPSVEAALHLRVESVERFSGNIQRVKEELETIAASDQVLVACRTDGEIHRLKEVLHSGGASQVKLLPGHIQAGFRLVGSGVVVLGSHQLFHREPTAAGVKGTRRGGARKIEGRAIDSFLDLDEGDYVVHILHGIARFRGMKMLRKNALVSEEETESADAEETLDAAGEAVEENLILEFRDGVLLYVPATRIELVQRYVGGAKGEPELSKLGGTAWGRRKEKATQAVRDMAADMIRVQALRDSVEALPFPSDSEWQQEFEDSFPFAETPDQLSAISEIKGDLERPKPMDRLLCGDVGYGKTEVAVRAAFKAIDNGKQVAVLVPTTVLAEQHGRTFSQRLAEYPFTVEVVSRFRTPAQQKEILSRLAEGKVDIVIGTHRLVGKGVKFKDLGLVVIDEEQRFGVEHKERLKHLRATLHVLTMTATPIPRTLHGALLGIREISNLETPPPDRLPVETRIIRRDDELIRYAILREMNRGGQVYFVHNRVHDIKDSERYLNTIVPEAKVVVGHGQMAEQELEKAMVSFLKKEADILLATTIIESGLDIPNANTIFVDDADQYGLADLHQLRGRVGRTKTRAYAYLLVDARKALTETAQKRLKAIEEFAALGSGFKIAMRDLEIRGAGNILGAEQSGHIAAIGYELYCRMLEDEVRKLKNRPPRVEVEVNVDLPWPSYLPRDYVPGRKARIEVYRRLSRLRDPGKLDDFRKELCDRYGPIPDPAEWLLKTAEIRLHCVRRKITSIHRDGKDLVFAYDSRGAADRLAQLSAGRLKVVDDKSLYLRLRPEEESPEVQYELLKGVLNPSSPA